MHLTQKKAEQMVAFCVEQFKSIGIQPGKIRKVELNHRAVKVNGTCTHHKKDGDHTITIMTIPSKLRTDEEVMNTVAHEICHTLAYGHGAEFHKLAKKVNSALGYNIDTCSKDSEETKQNRIANAKWHLLCECCNQVVGTYERKPASKSNAYHVACGTKGIGKLKLIQNK